MNVLKPRGAFNRHRFVGKKNRIVDLGRIYPTVAIEQSHFGNYAAPAKDSSAADSYIHRYSSVGRNAKFTHAGIGSFCSTSWDCARNAFSHPKERRTTRAFPCVPGWGGFVDERTQTHERIQTGNDLLMVTQVIVMPGVQIHDRAVIYAGAMVTRKVKAYEVVVGSPAKNQEWWFDEKIRGELRALRWWGCEDKKAGRNIRLFQEQLTLEDMEHLRSA